MIGYTVLTCMYLVNLVSGDTRSVTLANPN